MSKLPKYGGDYSGLKPGLYLGLFHGFPDQKTREEEDNWGEMGPVIGPLAYFQITYTDHQRGSFIDHSDMMKTYSEAFDRSGWKYYPYNRDGFFIPAKSEDCIYLDGMEYGDWTLFVIGEED